MDIPNFAKSTQKNDNIEFHNKNSEFMKSHLECLKTKSTFLIFINFDNLYINRIKIPI